MFSRFFMYIKQFCCHDKNNTESKLKKPYIDPLDVSSMNKIIFEQTPRGSQEIDYVKEAELIAKNTYKNT